MDFVALKLELTTDPAVLGYAAHRTSGNDGALAAILNDLTLGTSKGYTLAVAFVDAAVLQCAVVAAEYTLLSQPLRDLWQAILTAAQGGVPVKNAALRLQILAIWGAPTATRANLAALQTRTATRAEFLFGEDTIVSPGDVAQALRHT